MRKREVGAKLERAKELYIAGEIDRDHYDQERAEYDKAMASLQPQDSFDGNLPLLRLDDFGAIWALATVLERKGLLPVVFQEIRVRDGQITRVVVAPPFDRFLLLEQE